MPTPIDEQPTTLLIDHLYGESLTPYTVEEIQEELEARIVPNNYPDEDMRGGIRPYRPNL